MLKSKARRRIATRAAVAGSLTAGVLLGGVPAIASLITPVDVSYTCAPPAGTGGGTYKLNVELATPIPTPIRSATATVTWYLDQPDTSFLPAPSLLPSSASNKIVAEGDVAVSGVPIAPQPTTKTAIGTATPLTDVGANSPVPLPTMVVTLVPTATGTVGLRPDKFALKIVPSAAGAATATWYTCTPASAEAAAAAITFGVTTGSPAATSPSPSPTPTTTSPSPTSSSPKPTRTVFETVTQSPRRQVTRTPGGGAATGGGGDMGPDARMFLAVGSILVLGAGVGGLMMRRRRPQRG
ncbi:hypothetical protein [Sphaerisporangium aureirubrum]|uniref:Peptidase n=1 Tax=Sphaerisporangium aureirubrum TaxID=1544736 RepID=A0ABW1NC89_9ACTN